MQRRALTSLLHALPNYVTQRSSQSVATPDANTFVYYGPLAVTVTRLKKLSLFSFACSIVGGPLLVLWGAPGAPLAAQASIMVTICGFGFFTTALLHWFTSPYIHRLTYHKSSGLVEVDSLTFLAQHVKDSFHISELEYPDTLRPQVTFKAKNKLFYVDADNFADKELLTRLTPMDPAGTAHGVENLQSGKPHAQGQDTE
ncbi:hypothetical protein WJX72_000778 [[Myrmecia] bisecta]|uniref:Transmembrane protein 70 n=1 Tax=[Myrmecia] bisecta TaxID=41462 RepID=A0AAW1QP08_9CHLO